MIDLSSITLGIFSRISSFFVRFINKSEKNDDENVIKTKRRKYKNYRKCKECGTEINNDMIMYFAMDMEYCSEDCRVFNIV